MTEYQFAHIGRALDRIENSLFARIEQKLDSLLLAASPPAPAPETQAELERELTTIALELARTTDRRTYSTRPIDGIFLTNCGWLTCDSCGWAQFDKINPAPEAHAPGCLETSQAKAMQAISDGHVHIDIRPPA